MAKKTETEEKMFSVAIPITGVLYVTVYAGSEEEAIDKCFDGSDPDVTEQINKDNIETWDTHRKVVEGNMFNGTINEVEATEE